MIEALKVILPSAFAFIILILGLLSSRSKRKAEISEEKARTYAAAVEALKKHQGEKEKRKEDMANDLELIKEAKSDDEAIKHLGDIVDKFNRKLH